ncbi:hypothetical protein JCM14036_09640 [Desulfotomaculum defluvii]
MLSYFAAFFVIVIVLKLKKPLYLSMIAGTIATAFLFQISIKTFFSTLLNAAISWNTISILLVITRVLSYHFPATHVRKARKP